MRICESWAARWLALPLILTGPEVEVTIWKDRCGAFDAGDEAASWLSEHLGKPARLVRFDQRRKRPCEEEWTRGVEAYSQFADAYPWLLISQASLDELNTRLKQPLPMNRFRPNIVVDGLAPFGEDEVNEFIAGDVRLRAVKACTRCAITTTDQLTGERTSYEYFPGLSVVPFGSAPKVFNRPHSITAEVENAL